MALEIRGRHLSGESREKRSNEISRGDSREKSSKEFQRQAVDGLGSHDMGDSRERNVQGFTDEKEGPTHDTVPAKKSS